MHISYWSSDVCSPYPYGRGRHRHAFAGTKRDPVGDALARHRHQPAGQRFGQRHLAVPRGPAFEHEFGAFGEDRAVTRYLAGRGLRDEGRALAHRDPGIEVQRSEEHTSELQSLMRNSYAVFCLKKKTTTN